jgi:signal transduction histidine kinase
MQMPSPERIRIAQELHDGIAQDLVAIGYSLDLLLSEESLPPSTRTDIRTTRFAVDELITKVRSEILDLRKSDNEPFHLRLQRIAAQLCAGFDTAFNVEVVSLPEHQEFELFAIATEISRATHIGINLYPVNNRTCLEVIDNGIGGAGVKDGHYGVPGLIERVHNLGGSITIESIDGTRIAILI